MPIGDGRTWVADDFLPCKYPEKFLHGPGVRCMPLFAKVESTNVLHSHALVGPMCRLQ